MKWLKYLLDLTLAPAFMISAILFIYLVPLLMGMLGYGRNGKVVDTMVELILFFILTFILFFILLVTVFCLLKMLWRYITR